MLQSILYILVKIMTKLDTPKDIEKKVHIFYHQDELLDIFAGV